MVNCFGNVSIRRLISFLLLIWLGFLSAGLPITTLASIAPKLAIPYGKEIVLTIGLSHDYKTIYGADPNIEKHCLASSKNKTQFCAHYVYGYDLQILDWLENGHIDGAVVAPVALKLLHNSKRQSLSQHFRLGNYDAFSDKHFSERYIELTSPVNSDANSPEQSKAGFDAYLSALLNSDNPPENRIVLENQLSPALGLLFKEADKHLLDQSLSAEQLEQFWNRLFQRLDFNLNRIHENNSDSSVYKLLLTKKCGSSSGYCYKQSPVKDSLLLRKQAINKSLFANFQVPVGQELDIYSIYEDIVPEYLPLEDENDGLSEHVKAFVSDNYSAHQVGSQVRRYFRFTIPELMHVLDGDDDNREDTALVLTGGGVKAAYQTKLVDYLYSQKYLNNANVSPVQGDVVENNPLSVKYVIGTSGGALLGLFVSAINQTGDPQFSKHLWGTAEEDSLLTFTKVFPLIDMLRWLGFLFSVLVFTFSAILLYKNRWVREQLGIKSYGDGSMPVIDKYHRFWRFTFVWALFLVLTPFLIRYVNGDALGEHVPEIQGFFYFILVLLAIYNDNHILFDDRSPRGEDNDEDSKSKKRRTKVIFYSGLVLFVLSLLHKMFGVFDNNLFNLDATWEWLDDSLRWKITTNGFLFCAGLLFIARALQRWYFYHSPFSRLLTKEEGDVGKSYLVLLFMPVVGSLGIYLLYKLDIVSGLELTISYWKGLALVSFMAVSVIFIYAAYEHKKKQDNKFVITRLTFLLTRHPGCKSLHMNRHTRMLVLFSLAWLWWNIVMGPGMYGNNTSQDYIRTIYDNVVNIQSDTLLSGSSEEPLLALSTYFVAPVTSLENKNERYFLFEPTGSSVDRSMAIEYRHQLAISSDPRWTQLNPSEQTKDRHTQIAFASGSPFPVFPAHELNIDGKKEWFIDGGYAHNTPIDAARILGASKLLVIYSSPLELDSDEEDGLVKYFGTMVQNLPRLLPYLYQRSQVEDILSAKELTVAALAPSGYENGDNWPLLTDFRTSVVQSMFDEAEKDLDKRIGTIQNWGLPKIVNQ